MINSFRRIDPIFSPWVYGRNTELETLRGDFAESIAKNIQRDDFGEVTPDGGYWFHAGTEGQPRDRRFSVFCHVGMNLSGVTRNTVILKGSALVKSAAETHSYPIIHSALLAIVDAWAPDRSRRIAAGSLLGRKLIFRSVRHGCAIFAPNSPGGPCRPRLRRPSIYPMAGFWCWRRRIPSMSTIRGTRRRRRDRRRLGQAGSPAQIIGSLTPHGRKSALFAEPRTLITRFPQHRCSRFILSGAPLKLTTYA